MDIETNIYHLKESPLYASEKPYTMRYMPEESIPATNVTREKYNVRIRDLRGAENSYNLDEHGFTIAKVSTKMAYEDYNSHDQITSIYLQEVEGVLKRYFPGSQIDFISYLIRKRDAIFPYATGSPYPYGQPNIVAHIDATPSDLIRQITRRHGSEKAATLLEQRCQYITIWKPLKGPLYDWPLALCSGSSINVDADLEPQDIVEGETVLENVHVYHRPDHRWYYLSGQEENELLIFRQADTRGKGFGTPHCAIENPRAPEGCTPRESIEVVAFVYGT